MATQCATPDCGGEKIEGRRFCQPCASNLSRIRKELEEDPHLLFNKRSDNEKRIFEEKGKKSKKRPTCTTVGCFRERVPPAAFCFDCIDAGATEEEA